MKLLLGTMNKAKLEELPKYLNHAKLQLVTLKDIGFLEEAPETKDSFLKVALEKAKFYAKATEYPTLADDGGFEVDALDGQPGVNSKRWVGPKGTDEDRIRKIFRLLEGIPLEERTARLKLALVVYFPAERDYIFAEKSIEGIIPEKPAEFRIPDFPYRSVLFLPKLNKFYGELSRSEHQKINHRKAACKELLLKLEPYLNA